MRTTDQPLPLRERKKLRTRQALVETAVAMFTERGFDETTLDELVDAVEVSKRTFFRNFASKEDVVMTPVKQLWEAVLEVLAEHPVARLDAVKDALLTTLSRLDDDWYRQFLPSSRLIEEHPALRGYSLRYCDEIQAKMVCLLPGEPTLERRLLVEIAVGAWHVALSEWCPAGGRDRLSALLERAFAAIPAVVSLE